MLWYVVVKNSLYTEWCRQFYRNIAQTLSAYIICNISRNRQMQARDEGLEKVCNHEIENVVYPWSAGTVQKNIPCLFTRPPSQGSCFLLNLSISPEKCRSHSRCSCCCFADTVFFHLPPLIGDMKCVYGVSCYRQIEAKVSALCHLPF